MPDLTLQTTTALELSPELRLEVVGQLREYFAIQAAIKDLEASASGVKQQIGAVFDREGYTAALEAGVDVPGEGKLKVVRTTITGKVNVTKLLKQGVTMTQISKATDPDIAGTPYLKLTPAKAVGTKVAP